MKQPTFNNPIFTLEDIKKEAVSQAQMCTTNAACPYDRQTAAFEFFMKFFNEERINIIAAQSIKKFLTSTPKYA